MYDKRTSAAALCAEFYCDHPVVAMMSVKTVGRMGAERTQGMQWGVRAGTAQKVPEKLRTVTAERGCVAQGFNLVFVTTQWSQKVES
jgi:hypothetical protein